jgi:hypothetical protein
MRHCELCRFWGFKACPYDTEAECDEANGRGEGHGQPQHQFADNVSLDKCKDYLEEFGPAPIGWHYQIINANKKKRTYPKYILLQGYKDTDDGSYELVDTRKARVKMNSGRWYSMKRAKKDARAQGATWFTREKIWPSNGE